MKNRRWVGLAVVGTLSMGPIAACEQLPGDTQTQAAVIGGLGGAAVGGTIAEDNRLLGALIGGAVGAGGGYLIGAQIDKTDADDDDVQDARRAGRRAEQNPATAADVYAAETADLNEDGFVTTDEVIAMADAGLTDQQMLDRLEDSGQVFDLAPQQRQYLLDNGVSRQVVNQMTQLNREQLNRPADRDVIGS